MNHRASGGHKFCLSSTLNALPIAETYDDDEVWWNHRWIWLLYHSWTLNEFEMEFLAPNFSERDVKSLSESN